MTELYRNAGEMVGRIRETLLFGELWMSFGSDEHKGKIKLDWEFSTTKGFHRCSRIFMLEDISLAIDLEEQSNAIASSMMKEYAKIFPRPEEDLPEQVPGG